MTKEYTRYGLVGKELDRKIKKDWKLALKVIPDKVSGLSECPFAIGSLFGPIIGGRLTD